MYKEPTYSSGSGIEIFVGAPCCSINVPVVQVKRDITDRVSEVPYYKDPGFSSDSCYCWDVEELAGVELNSG